MTRTERALRNRLLALGLLLTLVVIACDAMGFLLPVEHFLSDCRTQWCQFFVPPPTDKLVHVDIDDTSQEFIGKWPWSRHTYAELVDEIRRSGAKALAWDVILSEATQQADDPSTQPAGPIDPDAEFAAALRRFGNVVIAVDFQPTDQSERRTPIQNAIVAELVKTPGLDLASLTRRLTAQSLPPPTSDDYVVGLHQAIQQRVGDAMHAGNPSLLDLRGLLFPGLDPEIDSPQLRVMDREYQRQLSLRQLAALGRPISPGLPPLLHVDAERPPIPALTLAAAYAGFVNIMDIEDGTVRSLPLWQRCDDRVYPLLGLGLACAYLGADLSSVQITPDAVTIPTPDGQAVIPVWTYNGSRQGQVGTYMDIPWFGKADALGWETMYDFPAHRVPRQHLGITDVWDACQTRQKIAGNNRNADDAIAEIMIYLDGDSKRADAYLAHLPDPADTAARRKLADDLLAQTAPFIPDPAAVKLETLAASDRRIVESILALKAAMTQAQSLEDQLRAQETALHSMLDGKAVLIGSIATGMGDFRPTPLQAQCPGVVVHGAVFNAILSRYTYRRAPIWVNWLLAIMVGCLATLGGVRLSPWRGLAATIALVLGYLLVNGELFYDRSHLIVGAASPMVAAGVVFGILILVRFIAEKNARDRITERFNSYVDPALVTYVIENPDAALDGQFKELTVVFTDLAGFSAMTERLQEHSIDVLNQYLDMMTSIIRAHRGLVNKFLGDGIMFFYGAPMENPNHADDAVDTVLAMHRGMIAFNHTMASRGLPTLVMRAGISTGKMVVGDAGGAGACDYTVLGDLVNLGARLESANKQFGSSTLIAEKTALKIAGRFLMRPIGRIQVKGKTKVVMAYEVLARIGEGTESQKQLTDLTEAMVDAFIGSEFTLCLDAAARLETAFGPSPLSKLYRRLSEAYLKDLPADFDGAIVLESK